jgi:hypothetical protein
MAKIKFGKWEFSEEELQRQLSEATRVGKEAEENEPHATKVYYDSARDLVVVELDNGAIFCIPPHLIQGLDGVTAKEIADVELNSLGTAIRWDALNIDLGVVGLLAGVYGTKAWMRELARKGGKAASEAKAEAARANGKKGGRPQKKFSDLSNLTHLCFEETVEASNQAMPPGQPAFLDVKASLAPDLPFTRRYQTCLEYLEEASLIDLDEEQDTYIPERLKGDIWASFNSERISGLCEASLEESFLVTMMDDVMEKADAEIAIAA